MNTLLDESEAKLERESILLHPEIKSWWVLNIMGPIEEFCLRFHISPNAITIAATIICISCFFLYAYGHFLTAGYIVLLVGSLDVLDGRVARATNQATRQGEFLDSVMDRYQDFLLLAGLAIFYRDTWMLYLVLAAISGTMFTSYVRAKADILGVDLSNIGTMQRPERFFMLGFGSIVSSIFQISLMPFYGQGNLPPHHILIAVIFVLSVTTNWTAIKRIRYTMSQLA